MRYLPGPNRWPFVLLGVIVVGSFAATSSVQADKSAAPSTSKVRPFTRLFVQDLATTSLKWVDVQVNARGEFSLGALAPVAGFKTLDSSRQKLVQMKESGGLLCVGVRDDDDGAFESGWVLVRTGVTYLDHGDHGHWRFKKPPQVVDSRLDKSQGNPAHLYLYEGRFFLANDRLNGYTRIDPRKYADGGKEAPRFLVGGGNHITLAVVGDRVGYSAWIDGGGPNKGRVDVTPITEAARSEPAYSFKLPSGGIHGAISNSGKVFFAPMDGICWVEADLSAKRKPEEVKVHHLDLGKDGDKPRRTGAFVNHGPYVLFVTGKQTNSALVLLDARQATPKPITVPLTVRKGTQPLTPITAVTPEGKAYAFIFHDHAKGVEVEDALDVIALDPNGDGDCTDARVLKTLKVGNSAVEGHYGHHDLAFDSERRFGFFTNPGDGTLSMLSLRSLEIVQTFKVGGTPTAIEASGSRETDD